MKAIFQSNSGKVFKTSREAERWNAYMSDLTIVLNPFHLDIKAGQWVQRTKSEVKTLISDGLRLLETYHSNYPEVIKLWKDNPRGWVGRLLDDGDIPVDKIYYTLLSIDQNDRQWSQPYYAIQANREINGS